MAETDFGYVTPSTLPLFTDLYELTMFAGYVAEDHAPRATFDLFVRDLPPDRGYLLSAGLEQAVHAVERLSFDDEAIAYLAERGLDAAALDALADLSFTGDVRAMPEGTPVFPNEPLLSVTAPLPEAQLLETVLINQVGFATMVATKAARMAEAVDRYGDGQTLVDFGSRRAHGTDAGMKAARAAYVGGFEGTSNVAAGRAFDLPVFGTMAHSWVQSFPTERAAFEAFVRQYGADSVLLIDTYDTLAGAETAAAVADEQGVDLAGVRIDSGDLAALSTEVADVAGTDVFVSSGIDEYRIREFFGDGGVAAGFGVGTQLVTSADAPTTEAVYKLAAVERDGTLSPTMKHSAGKASYPGRKAVGRVRDGGRYSHDVLGLLEEDLPGEDPMETVVEDGTVVYDVPSLSAIRERATRERRRLPDGVRDLEDPDGYEVRIGPALADERERLREELASRGG